MSEKTLVEFPMGELPDSHFWLIVPMTDYWSVEIVYLDEGSGEYVTVASSSNVDFSAAVADCLAQLANAEADYSH